MNCKRGYWIYFAFIINNFTKNVFCRFEIYPYLQLPLSEVPREFIEITKANSVISFNNILMLIIMQRNLLEELIWVDLRGFVLGCLFDQFKQYEGIF